MGQVFFENGEAVIKRPIAEGRLVISLKSEDYLLFRYKNMSRNFLIATIVLLSGGSC
ncbi:MAG: GIDE domain-containing protein [Pseudanabaenaceae cyanobacterium]